MKKNFICIITAMLALSSIAACSYAQQKIYNIQYRFNKFEFENGETLTIYPTLDKRNNPAGASFTRIEYYLDGQHIATKTSIPFNLSFVLQGITPGTHNLSIKAYLTADGRSGNETHDFEHHIIIKGTLPTGEGDNPSILREKGDMYYFGRGVAKDYSMAFHLYKEAAIGGDANAMYKLSSMYHSGKGVLRSNEQALYWCQKSIEKGKDGAHALMGEIYYERGNYINAMHCFKQEAFKKYSSGNQVLFSQYVIGTMYEQGLGIEKNIEEAKKWYKMSADGGYEPAKKELERLGGYVAPIPLPTPNVNLAQLTWRSPTAETKQKTYNLEVGINSNSKVDDVTIYVNGEASRAANAVTNDGYTSVVRRTITLAEGNNLIQVNVRNASGTARIEKTIVLKVDENRVSNNDRRIALVIGNANYGNGNTLRNPVNDATDLAGKLERLGFHVIKGTDQSHKAMDAAIADFSRQAANYDVALFFYAGHGISSEGYNYLVPVDANLPDEASVKYECANASRVLDGLDKSGCKMKIIILDACRNNPFERAWNRAVDNGGLAIMNAPTGTFIAYSTAPGCTASDGLSTQRNSPFTSVMLKVLDKENLSLTDFFQEVLENVASNTNGKQVPWLTNSFLGKFYFNRK